MATNAITRKEIIEDEALKWGEQYVKMIQPAIDKNKEFVDSILALNDANKKSRTSSSIKELSESQAKANSIGEQAIVIWKEQIMLENALISTIKKNELATEGTNKAYIKQRTILNETNLEIKRQAIANGALESAYKKLSAQVAITGDRLKNIIATGKLASESQAQYNSRLKQAQTEFDKLNSKVRAADAAVGTFNRNVGNYPKQAAEGLKNLISAFGVVTGIALFASVMKDAFNSVREFEKEIVNLAAIAGKSRTEIAPLESKIREIARTSVNGATDVAKLATELIKLGSTTEEAEKLLEPINNLSIALQASAEDSATLVKATLNAFGAGADEATHFTDVFAEAANRSALDFEGLKNSLGYIAPSAKQVGISIEKTAAIIGTLADNGVQAERAGRLMQTSFVKLASSGLSLDDALRKINEAQEKGATGLELLKVAGDLFGDQTAGLGVILANNVQKINDSTVAYQNSGGALKELTDKQLNSLDSQLKILSSAWTDYILETNNTTGSTISLTSGIKFLSTNLKVILSVLGYSVTAWLGYKAAVALARVQQGLFALTTTEATVAQQANVVVTGFGTTAQTANAAATTVATTAWQRFNTALKANALLLIVSVLVAAIYALNKFNKSLSDINEETKKTNEEFLKNRDELTKNAVATKTLSSRYEELQNKAKKLGGETKLTAAEQSEMQRITKELSLVVPGAVSAVNKYGEALKLNTDLLKKYNVENAKILEIDKNKAINDEISLQKDLAKGIKDRTENLKNFKKVEGEGSITTEFIVAKERELSVLKVDLILSQGRLKSLKGLTEAEKEAAKASDEKTKTQVVNSARTIEIIDAEIEAQEALIKGLSDKSGKEGRVIKNKIASLNAEKELIYSTAKAEKDKLDNGLKNARKVNDAIYQLTQFRYQNEINNNQKIIDSEKSTNEQRINALLEINQIQESKNADTLQNDLLKNALELDGLDKFSKQKFQLYKKDAEARIASIIDGKVATEKLTNEEKLILEKYYAEKKNLEEKSAKDKQTIVDNEVAILQKQIDAELLAEDTKLQKVLDSENTLYQNALEAADGNHKLIQNAEEEHQRRLYEIKKEFSKKGLQLQIDEIQKLLDDDKTKEASAQISAEKRKDLENKLQKYQTELNALGTEDFKKNLDERTVAEAAFNEQVKDMAMQLKEALVGLVNSLFEAKIANIDAEIQANDDFFNHEIELAGNDARQKDLLEKEREKKRVALEKKKRKAEYDAAVFNKATQAAQIIGATALAVISTLAQVPKFDFGISASAIAAIYAGIGAIQLATLLATPLPKYKTGRKGGKEEFAITGDGGVSEVVTDRFGNNPTVTPNVPTFTYLREGDIVHKSVDEYQKYIKASYYNSFDKNANSAFQYQNTNGDYYSKEVLDELKRTTKAIEKNKANITLNNKIDFGYEFWRHNNINWNKK